MLDEYNIATQRCIHYNIVMTKRLSTQTVQDILSKNNLVLTSEYINARMPITVRCSKGHIWHTIYDTARKTPCAYCTDKVHKTRDDYVALAKSVGFQFIGEIPKRTTDKALWLCPSGHKIKQRFLCIKHGNGCAVCGQRARLTSESYNRLASALGITWLGPLPKNTVSKTKWKCPKGHIFTTTFASVRHKGKCRGCAICSRTRIGPDAPAWKGGEYQFRYRDRLKRANLINRTPDDQYLTAMQWKRAKAYWGNSCAYCRDSSKPLQRDHFIPVASGGLHTATNILPACPMCNSSKNSKLPLDWLIKRFGIKVGKGKFKSITKYLHRPK